MFPVQSLRWLFLDKILFPFKKKHSILPMMPFFLWLVFTSSGLFLSSCSVCSGDSETVSWEVSLVMGITSRNISRWLFSNAYTGRHHARHIISSTSFYLDNSESTDEKIQYRDVKRYVLVTQLLISRGETWTWVSQVQNACSWPPSCFFLC